MNYEIQCTFCKRSEADGATFGDFGGRISKPVCDRCGWDDVERIERRKSRQLWILVVVLYFSILGLMAIAGGLF